MDKPALISLTFDDGLRCQFEQAVPILDQYSLLATFFLTANTSPIHIDWYDHLDWRKIEWSADDIRLLKSVTERGHEIGSHSVWHKVPDPDNPKFRSDFDPKYEAEESKRLIEGWLGTEVSSYCYPFCLTTEPVKNAVIGAGYKQARAGANASYVSHDSVDWFDVDCRHIGRDGAEDVSAWVQSGRWHVLMFHGIGTLAEGWWPVSIAEFDRQMAELAKYRDSGAVEVVTFKNGADRLRRTRADAKD